MRDCKPVIYGDIDIVPSLATVSVLEAGIALLVVMATKSLTYSMSPVSFVLWTRGHCHTLSGVLLKPSPLSKQPQLLFHYGTLKSCFLYTGSALSRVALPLY
jgi:hypothetical protein